MLAMELSEKVDMVAAHQKTDSPQEILPTLQSLDRSQPTTRTQPARRRAW